MDTGNELDEILSGDTAPAAAAIPEATPAAPTEAAPAVPDQPRGPDGKFAPKAGEPEAPTATPAASAEPEPPNGFVPHGRFHAVNETAKAEKARADRLEAMLEQAINGRQQPPPQPAAPPKAPKEIWDGPEEFTRDIVGTAVQPLQAQVSNIVFTYSKRDAVREFGEETVSAAEAALQQAVKAGTLNADTLRKQLTESMDPVGDVVKWHKKQAALERVGTDPDKWLESELERRLSDPAEQAKILERINASTASAPRSGQTPAIQLPPSLSRLPGGGNAAPAGGLSDGELFAHATAR